MTKYILGFFDEEEAEGKAEREPERAHCGACGCDAEKAKLPDELSWADAAHAIDRFRKGVQLVFGFSAEHVVPVYIADPRYPFDDAAFDCKGYSYEVKDGKLTCTGQVGR